MTRGQTVRRRDKLAAQLPSAITVLRGSLLQRTIHHSSGCWKCARGEGHLLWVLNVGYPGGKTRQVSLRPDQVPQVREALENYRTFKRNLEAISELNQFRLRLDRQESKDQERQSPAACSAILAMASSPRRRRIYGNPGCDAPKRVGI